MGLFQKLFNRPLCLVCGGGVDEADGRTLTASSKDPASPLYESGGVCPTCNRHIHYKCCRSNIENKGAVAVTTLTCPKCKTGILGHSPKVGGKILRKVEVYIGVLLFGLTVYVGGFSPISVNIDPERKTILQNPITGTRYRPALELGPVFPLIIVFFCMCLPSYQLIKRDRSSKRSTFDIVRIALILYGIGILLLWQEHNRFGPK